MPQLYKAVFSTALLTALLAVTVPARLSGQATDDYLKSLLNQYYTGKIVRARVAIPADKKGLEIVDGLIRNAPASRIAAEPGDPLLISQLRFKSHRIEVQFDSEGSEPAAGKNFAGRNDKHAAPRIQLQFTREITTRDLNIRTINNLLASAIDVSSLTPKSARPAAESPTGEPRKRNDPGQLALMLAERRARAEGIPAAEIRTEGSVTEPGIGELTIECSAGQARFYIDGAFSGHTPRTIRLRAGVHTILVIGDAAEAWEKQFFIPAGHSSAVRAELLPVESKQRLPQHH